MLRSWFGNDTARTHDRRLRRAPARRGPALALELLEDRTVPNAFTWNGLQSTDWADQRNWNTGTSGIPLPGDDVLINTSSPNNPTLSAPTTILSLTVNTGAGTITLNANLTVNGTYSQNAGTVNLANNTLTVKGNPSFNAGSTPPATGTLLLAGTSLQTLGNSSGKTLPNLTINNASGVTTTGTAFNMTSLTVLAGTFTLIDNNPYSDTGFFTQSGGSVSLNSTTTQLQIAGNVTRTGVGTFSGAVGTVVLNGGAGQTINDSTFNPFPNLLISNTTPAGVTIPGSTLNGGVSRVGAANVTLNANCTLTLTQASTAAFLVASGGFTDNGKVVLSQLTPNGNNLTALIKVTGALALSATSAFDLFVGGPTGPLAGVYQYITYASVTGAASVPAGNIVVHGYAAPIVVTSKNIGTTALTVTLASPGVIDTWTGGSNSNFANGANWSNNAPPGASDRAVIQNAPNDPILSVNTTVGSLEVIGGFLTINANVTLTVAGNFLQNAGFLALGSGAQLQIAGDVIRTGGVFLGATGTVVFNGTSQSITDTSGHAFGWDMMVNSGTTVTVQAGSVLSVADNFTNNGTVNLSMTSPSPSSATPLQIGNNLVEGAGSVFNLTLGNQGTGLTYIFITFGGTETRNATFTANAGTVNHNAHNITVTT
jgi:hypothetical protein